MAQMMDDNAKLATPLTSDALMREAADSISVGKCSAGSGAWFIS